MHCMIQASAAVFNIRPQNLACCLSLWYSLLWKTWLVEPGSSKEKRSYPDDYTLFRIFTFGGCYGIANKLIYFNCSGMYVFPVPTYPCLFLAHQNSCGFFFSCEYKEHEKKLFSRHQREWTQNDQTEKIEQKSKYWLFLWHLMILRPAFWESKNGKKEREDFPRVCI